MLLGQRKILRVCVSVFVSETQIHSNYMYPKQKDIEAMQRYFW